jgi:hypothetical protein
MDQRGGSDGKQYSIFEMMVGAAVVVVAIPFVVGTEIVNALNTLGAPIEPIEKVERRVLRADERIDDQDESTDPDNSLVGIWARWHGF